MAALPFRGAGPPGLAVVSRAGESRPVAPAGTVFGRSDVSLLDIVDNVLSKGVVLTGELTIALADVDLIYARLSVLLCAADRVLPRGPGERAVPGRGTPVRRPGPRA